MSVPKRIQLSRRKGWRKPEGAVVVARPTRWGNPWRVGVTQMRSPRIDGLPGWELEGRLHKRSGEKHAYFHSDGRVTWHEVRDATIEECVAMFREDMTGKRHLIDFKLPSRIAEIREALSGKDLACWCPLDEPCHADVLLELANREDD